MRRGGVRNRKRGLAPFQLPDAFRLPALPFRLFLPASFAAWRGAGLVAARRPDADRRDAARRLPTAAARRWPATARRGWRPPSAGLAIATRSIAGPSPPGPPRRVAPVVIAGGLGGGRCSGAITPPRASTRACSMALRSSRTLPYQGRPSRAATASADSADRGQPFLAASSSVKCSASGRMSSRRCRNGGKSISNVTRRKYKSWRKEPSATRSQSC